MRIEHWPSFTGSGDYHVNLRLMPWINGIIHELLRTTACHQGVRKSWRLIHGPWPIRIKSLHVRYNKTESSMCCTQTRNVIGLFLHIGSTKFIKGRFKDKFWSSNVNGFAWNSYYFGGKGIPVFRLSSKVNESGRWKCPFSDFRKMVLKLEQSKKK